jgi:hypothetical protein
VKLLLKGFPSEVGEKIEIPNIAELMFMPQFANARLDDVYRFCNDDLKNMIDKAPLKNDKRYVTISAQLQLATPNTRTVFNKIGYKDEWHIDGKSEGPSNGDLRAHLLLSDCNCRTEFNLNPLEIEIPDNIDLRSFNEYINANQEELGLIPKKMDSGKFVTFDSHMHRTSPPLGKEFRYILRIVESDGFFGDSLHDSYAPMSFVYDIHRKVKSIEQFRDHVRIYDFD